MRIQHNIMALNAYRQLGGNNSALAKNLEKLSSGYRINRAGDDAAGLAISEKMRAQIKGLEAAQKNANDGISLVQTAEGALTEVHSMLNRMVYLATQSANGTYDNEVDRANLDKEVQTLKEEINRISQSTNFNGIKLLDGSMDSAIKTVNNKVSDGFKIADWVGTTANADAVVGAGTIVHKDAQEVQKAKFAVELNNSTAKGENGVSIQLGENEKISLTKDEIAAGASAEDIVKAFAEKFKDTGVNLKSADGTDVKFNVTADGDRLVFEQAEDPKTASDIVNVSMEITYEGIGAGAEKAPALNTTELKAADIEPTKNLAHVGATTFAWANGVTDETKDALNKAMANGAEIKVITTAGAATHETDVAGHKVDISGLLGALGDGYTVTAKEDDSTNSAPNVITADDKGVFTLTGANDSLALTIKDADGNNVGTLSLTLAARTGGLAANAGGTGIPANATAGAELRSTIQIGAGNNNAMNINPATDVDDKGNMKPVFAFDGNITTAQKDALNQVIAAGDQSIKIQMSGLDGNKVKDGTKINIELSQALKDAGYYITTDPADKTAKYNDETGYSVVNADHATANKVFGLYDKDGNKIGQITVGTKDQNGTSDATNLNGDASTITLSASQFNAETPKTSANGGLKETVKINLTAAAVDDTKTPTDISSINWGDNAGSSLTWNDGDKLTMTIDGKDYEVTMKNGGLTKEETDSGKFIDISTAANVNNGSKVMALLQTAVGKQMAANAKEAAKGTDDYVEYNTEAWNATTNQGGLHFVVNADDPTKIDVTATTQKFTYVGKPAGADDPADPDAPAVPGGKDPNASTVSIQTGAVAGEGRLASTYITDEDLAGLKDGSQLKVGDTVYTFAVGKDSKVTGDNVIKVNGEVGDADLGKKALDALSNMTNEMFSIGHDDTRVTFTENKEYKWGEGVDLGTHAGIAEQFGFYIDGMTSTTNGKALSLQVGDTADDYQKVGLDIKDMSTDGLDIADIDIKTQESASAAIDKIKAAINTVSSQRGDLGAIQNRLEHTINNLGVQTENITAAESRIRDTDMAEEMMAYTKNNILIQAAQAMLAQANQVPQGVLQLLQ